MTTLRTGGLLVSAAALLLAACGAEDVRPRPGEMQLNGLFEADFSLVDMHGAPATDERFEGQPLLIYYGFASCPDVCPAALSVLSASLDALGRDAARITPLFVTVDPARDTPDVLRRHLAFDERILGLTGDEAAIRAAAEDLRVAAVRRDLPDSALGYTMDHTSFFYLIDAEGTPVAALDDGMAPEDIAAVVRRYL